MINQRLFQRQFQCCRLMATLGVNAAKFAMFAAICLQFSVAEAAKSRDGYGLWLDYQPITNTREREGYIKALSPWQVEGEAATADFIRQELTAALGAMLGVEAGPVGDYTHNSLAHPVARLLVATPEESAVIRSLALGDALTRVGQEGYLIKTTRYRDKPITIVTANTHAGLLYGTFKLLQLLQTGQAVSNLAIESAPATKLRVLNHWDNLDRYVERGYAGESIWNWHKLPHYKSQRYYDYARANASIGINGVVLNNVNADPLILTPQYLVKVKALADIFRPYGIKVYLSVKFSSPNLIGGLPTSDPLDKNVQAWWQAKANEIYSLIPDFGGFLVKANSEGQPGPGDFGRSHAQGANMLADALAPHGGNVMWRAFVYNVEANVERSKQAYNEFKPLDGTFRQNVLVQVKNGPIDFQPREPFSPLFGAMPKTPLMMEFQITQEYLGFSTHLVYLGPLYEEVLKADTYAKGAGSTVAKVVDGSLYGHGITGMAGVANIGSDRNWTGHIFGQANWYVFGQLAWNPEVSTKQIADDWIRMTLTRDDKAVNTIRAMMMASRETAVNYMTPLGLHHIMGWGHHYGPAPWIGEQKPDWMREDWTSVYYHSANATGLGKDRTASGSNVIAQYHAPLRQAYSDPKTTPTELLLWFHHLPWHYELANGNSLWHELVARYYLGAQAVAEMAKTWDGLEANIPPQLFKQVQMALAIQTQEAAWWRDACVLYFQSYSKQSLPEGFAKPKHSLEYYKGLSFPHAPGDGR
ncbi:alpha-glucuronidase family glycosyl hydrolase [Saccharophagus degradans]|uniref:Xylan alpha-1,2-glucuronidase n=1 Tax=Saccharophagus degradans (strain 2-40 / ATCC 43961 / DSM 17024) TaxID=203122 RepID=Q21LZ2_SACD2|nr:alpha-glucuronidase family glycosyl hydrolase [Saccharophagus degradans]ABD80287.1 putative a-glucuronidase [Saccharophagus degradans 2-40]